MSDECEHVWIEWRSWELCEKCGVAKSQGLNND